MTSMNQSNANHANANRATASTTAAPASAPGAPTNNILGRPPALSNTTVGIAPKFVPTLSEDC